MEGSTRAAKHVEVLAVLTNAVEQHISLVDQADHLVFFLLNDDAFLINVILVMQTGAR